MKCPLRIGRRPYDGGEECDIHCAWCLIDVDESQAVCALAVMAAYELRDHGITTEQNSVNVEWDFGAEKWKEVS